MGACVCWKSSRLVFLDGGQFLVHFRQNCWWLLGEFSTIQTVLPLAEALIGLESEHSAAPYTRQVASLLPDAQSHPCPSSITHGAGCTCTPGFLPTKLDRTVLQILPWSYFLQGKGALATFFRLRHPNPPYPSPASFLPSGQLDNGKGGKSCVARGTLLRVTWQPGWEWGLGKCWKQCLATEEDMGRKAAHYRLFNAPSLLSLPWLCREFRKLAHYAPWIHW